MIMQRIRVRMRLHAKGHRNPYDQTAPHSVFPENVQSPISSNIDDKATHEVTLRSFVS